MKKKKNKNHTNNKASNGKPAHTHASQKKAQNKTEPKSKSTHNGLSMI